MQYFDLNIPFLEDPPSGKTTPSERAARKKTRLKLVVKAVELGYSGVAYNRLINGVMSESDRCSVSLFPLSNLLALCPSLSSSTSFHRRLLYGQHAAHSPFRQYTRITLSVDNDSQSSSLNSGNPILKTYDLVAVRPMNQKAFDQACENSKVDLIAIDLSDKMPFRLKLPMVKAAIARGVYFEITYSSLIVDIQVRRQVISNAKVLVDWTRGKNLIVSSAAPSALEFRGPNDVANLLSLLGLAAEHAKAAISKNCRDLITKALRRKQFSEEAVKVNAMPSTDAPDPNKPWIIDSMEWDPISSGEGDLLLEDLAKSFSEAIKGSETLKPCVTSSVNNIAPHGLIATNLGAETKKSAVPSSETQTIRICSQRKPMSFFSIPLDHHRVGSNDSQEPFLLGSEVGLTNSVLATNLEADTKKSAVPSSETETIRICSQRKPMSVFGAPLGRPEDASNASHMSDSEIVMTDSVNTVPSSASECRLKDSDILDVVFAPNMMQEDPKCIRTQLSVISNTGSILKKCSNSEDGEVNKCDYEVSAQFKDVVLSSETTHVMMVDGINADPVVQNVIETSSLPQMEVSLNPSEATELMVQEKVDKEVFLPADNGEILIHRDPVVKDGLPVDPNLGKNAEKCDIMLDIDSVEKGGLPVDLSLGDEAKECDIMLDRMAAEEKNQKEVEYCIHETNSHLSTKSDSIILVNPCERMSDSNDMLIHDSGMDLKVGAQEANYHSRIRTKSVKRMIRERRYIRFPFKHLLQVPFKRKSATYRHEIRKR